MNPIANPIKPAPTLLEKPRRHNRRHDAAKPVQIDQDKKINELVQSQVAFRTDVRAEVKKLEALISKDLHPEVAEGVSRLVQITVNSVKKPDPVVICSPLEHQVNQLRDNFNELNAKLRIDHTDAKNDAVKDPSCESMRKKIEGYISLHNRYTKQLEELNSSVLNMMKTLEEPIQEQRNQLPLKEAEIKRVVLCTGIPLEKIKSKEEKSRALFQQRLDRLNTFIAQWNSAKSFYDLSYNMLNRYINTYRHGGVASYEFTRSWGLDSPFNKSLRDTKFTEISKVAI